MKTKALKSGFDYSGGYMLIIEKIHQQKCCKIHHFLEMHILYKTYRLTLITSSYKLDHTAVLLDGEGFF